MFAHERIGYANQMLGHELEKIARVVFLTEDEWVVHFLSQPNVDPTGAHKPFGLTAPQWVTDEILIGVCVPLLVRPLTDHDDDEFQSWLEYWIIHTGLHLIINQEAIEAEETLTLAEIERRVNDRFVEEAHGSFWFAEMVRDSIRGVT